MKKIIKYSSICLVISLLLTSCNSKFSLTKRHYNKGYYFAHAKNTTSNSLDVKSKKIEQIPVVKSVEPKKALNILSEQITTNVVTPKKIEPSNLVITASNQKNKTFAKSHNTVNTKSSTIFHQRILLEKHIADSKKLNRARSNDDGYSLLWIIILVLLILWAIGLLGGGFGLGGLIYVLLVIALILLILWLLRIL